MTPRKVQNLKGEGLMVEWSDGTIQNLSSKLLRDNCPSAVSLASAKHDKPLGFGRSKLSVVKHEAELSYSLERVWVVGNYALGIKWGDGHDSGIYTFEHLRELGEQNS